MHTIALEKAFQTICLDFSFVTDPNPPKLATPNIEPCWLIEKVLLLLLQVSPDALECDRKLPR